MSLSEYTVYTSCFNFKPLLCVCVFFPFCRRAADRLSNSCLKSR